MIKSDKIPQDVIDNIDKSTPPLEINKIPSKTSKNTPKLSQRDIAYSLLRKEGLNNTEASAGLGITTARGSQITSKLNKKYDLKEESYLKPAALAVKRILRGKTFGEVATIKDSTVLSAAAMVYDRLDPIVKHNVNSNINVNFTEINLGDIK